MDGKLNFENTLKNLNLDITNLDGEIWVPCIGYEDIYSISNKYHIVDITIGYEFAHIFTPFLSSISFSSFSKSWMYLW